MKLPMVYWGAEIVILSLDLLLVAMGSSLTNFVAFESSDDFWLSSGNQGQKSEKGYIVNFYNFHTVELTWKKVVFLEQ